MFSKLKNQVDNLTSKVVENIDSGIEKTKEFSENTLNQADTVYEDEVKTFLTENKEKVKEMAMENELFSKLVVDGLTRSVAIPIIATIVYNLLPSPIQFIVNEDSFVSFVGNNLSLLETILELSIAPDTIIESTIEATSAFL